MDGKQQKPPTQKNEEEEPRLRPKENLQEPNGRAECRRENGSDVVQVSILSELPSNERKRNKTDESRGEWYFLALFNKRFFDIMD